MKYKRQLMGSMMALALFVGNPKAFDIEDSVQKRSQTLGQRFYLKHTFADHPTRIMDKGGVFGRIEVVDSEEGTLFRNWMVPSMNSHGFQCRERDFLFKKIK